MRSFLIIIIIILIMEKARKFAIEKHGLQRRKFTGEMYYFHPIRVAEIIQNFENNESVIAAAYMHDLIEDTDVKYEDILQLFGTEIANLVFELTNVRKMIEKMGKKIYQTEKLNNMSDNAFLIKLADRLDNVSDFKISDQYFAERYSKETLYVLDHLNRKITKNQKVLIKRIREKCENYLKIIGETNDK